MNNTMFDDAGIEAVGLNEFRRLYPTITGKGVRVLQVEWPEGGGGWAPPDASYLPVGVVPVIGYHASEVAKVVRLVAPGSTLLSSNAAWFERSFGVSINVGALPLAEWDVENHSYTANYNLLSSPICQAQDVRVLRDDVLSYGSCGNAEGEVTPIWNRSREMDLVGGYATPKGDVFVWDKSYQAYPDIYAPTHWSSIASPVLAGCAALLIELFPTRRREIQYALKQSRVGGVARVDIAAQLLEAGPVSKPEPDPLFDQEPPSVPTGLVAVPYNSIFFRLSWNPSSDNKAVSQYRVFADGNVYVGGVNKNSTYCGLPPVGKVLAFQVMALDSSGNPSVPSEPLWVNDVGASVPPPSAPPVDTEPPTAPSALQYVNVTKDGATVSWNPSTDNITVMEYKVYVNGALFDRTSLTEMPLTGFLPGTTLETQVSATDAAGNVSDLSAPLVVTTLTETPIPDPVPPPTPPPDPVPPPVELPTPPDPTLTRLTPLATYTCVPDAFEAAGEGLSNLTNGNPASKALWFAQEADVVGVFLNPVGPTELVLHAANDSPERDPKDGELRVDGQVVLVWSDQVWGNRYEKKVLPIPVLVYGKKVTVHFRSSGVPTPGGVIVQVGNMDLFGYVGEPSTPPPEPPPSEPPPPATTLPLALVASLASLELALPHLPAEERNAVMYELLRDVIAMELRDTIEDILYHDLTPEETELRNTEIRRIFGL